MKISEFIHLPRAKFISTSFSLGYWAKGYHSVFLGSCITLVLPTLAVIVADIVDEKISLAYDPVFWIALLLLVVALLLWIISTEQILEWITRLCLKDKFREPKLAIVSIKELTDTEIQNKKLLKWTEITPSKLADCLDQENFKSEQLNIDEINNNYSMIINPFGELYPEEDIPNMESLIKIKKYIHKGGVFINTAGLAFAYMWNVDTGAEEFTGGRLMAYKSIQQGQNSLLIPVMVSSSFDLLDTCLFRNFGVRTTLFDAEKESFTITESPGFEGILDDLDDVDKKLPEFRSALRCENPEYRLIPILKTTYNEDGRLNECYPAAALRYGGGYLILFGIHLKGENTLSIVVKTLNYLVSKLKVEGTLESN